MGSQLSMLLWKEWRERRSQFLVCLLWMVGGVVYNIVYEWFGEFRAPVAGFYGTGLLFGLFMPIFVAMRTSLGETTDRTRAFTSALPISGRRRGWIRLAGGAAVLIVPILSAAAIVSLCLALGWIEQASPRPPSGPYYVSLPDRERLSAQAAVALVWQVAAVAVCSATGLYVLLSLLGSELRAEAHAGFAGAAVAILWFLGGFLEVVLEENGLPGANAIVPQGTIVCYSYGNERGQYGDLMISSAILGPLLVNAILQLALAMWFVRRYSRRLPSRASEAVRKTPPRVWRPWSVALPTRSIALIWLTLRQSVPMCLPGLLIACLMTPMEMGDVFGQCGGVLERFADSLPSSMWVIGLLWSVVVGAGLFSAEIDWRVGEFWRTRPIPFWRFFSAKFFVGLLAVLLVLDATTIAVSWNSPNWGDYHSMNWPYIACIVPLHAVMFAMAAAWTCVLRRPAVGGMVAIVCFAMLQFAMDWSQAARCLDPIEVYNHLASRTPSATEPIDFTAHGYPLLAAAMGAVLLGSIVVGGLALRRYDPRRQSG